MLFGVDELSNKGRSIFKGVKIILRRINLLKFNGGGEWGEGEKGK